MIGYAISGKAGAGKSTLAALLVDQLQHFGVPAERHAFGDALKREVFEEFGLTKDDPGGREKLIEWGEARRAANPLYWVNQLAPQIERCIFFGIVPVVDDVRFLSELGYLHCLGFHTIRLDAPVHLLQRRTPHALRDSVTETELDPWGGWTHRYVDDGSLDLFLAARLIVMARERAYLHT